MINYRADIIYGTKKLIPVSYKIYAAPTYGLFGRKKTDWVYLYETTNPPVDSSGKYLWESEFGICGVDIEDFKKWKETNNDKS